MKLNSKVKGKFLQMQRGVCDSQPVCAAGFTIIPRGRSGIMESQTGLGWKGH